MSAIDLHHHAVGDPHPDPLSVSGALLPPPAVLLRDRVKRILPALVLPQLPHLLIVCFCLEWPDMLSFLLPQCLIVWWVIRRGQKHDATVAIEAPVQPPPSFGMSGRPLQWGSTSAAFSLLLCTACFAYLTFVAALPFGLALQFTAAVFVHCDPLSAGSPLRSFRGPAALELTVYICGFLAVYPALQQQLPYGAEDNSNRDPTLERWYFDGYFQSLMRLALYFKVRNDLMGIDFAEETKDEDTVVLVQRGIDGADKWDGSCHVEDGEVLWSLHETSGVHEPTGVVEESSVRSYGISSIAIARLMFAYAASLTFLCILRSYHHVGAATAGGGPLPATTTTTRLLLPLSVGQMVSLFLLKLSVTELLSLFHEERSKKTAPRESPKKEDEGVTAANSKGWIVVVTVLIPMVWSARIVWESVVVVRAHGLSSQPNGDDNHDDEGTTFQFVLSCLLPTLVWLFSVGWWMLEEVALQNVHRPGTHAVSKPMI